jgi:hypothetical protein
LTTTDNCPSDCAAQTDWHALVAKLVEGQLEPKWRREYRRHPVRGKIEATSLPDLKVIAPTWDLREVSNSGLTAGSRKEVAEGDRFILDVSIDEHTIRVKGKVRHCTQTIGGYKVGVQLIFDS